MNAVKQVKIQKGQDALHAQKKSERYVVVSVLLPIQRL